MTGTTNNMNQFSTAIATTTNPSSTEDLNAASFKMSTRSSTGALPIKLEIMGDGDHSRHEQQRDDARDPHDSSVQSDQEREDSPTSRTSSPASEVDLDNDAAVVAAEQAVTAVDHGKKKSAASSSSLKAAEKKVKAAAARARRSKKAVAAKKSKKAEETAFGDQDVASSFDHDMATVVGPSASFGELPLGNCPTPRQQAQQGHLRQPSGISTILNMNCSGAIPANLPMSELDNPSWDLLNQDSFGFNLTSLSFETGEQQQQQDHHHHHSAKEDGNGTIKSSGNRERERSVDLTSAVTASLDDTPNKQQHNMDWAAFQNNANSVLGDNNTTIVNSMNHNWIPPHSPTIHNHHPSHLYSHHHTPHSHYNVGSHPPPPHGSHGHGHHPLQESRSDIPHSYLYSPELRDTGGGGNNNMGNFMDDPFKYAFGDPNAPHVDDIAANADNALMHPNSSRRSTKSSSSSSTGRARSKSTGRNSRASSSSNNNSRGGRTNKKRKPVQQEPLDGHDSPPPLQTIESAPTSTLEMMNPPPLDPSWSTSPGASRRRGNPRGNSRNSGRTSRSRISDKQQQQHSHYSAHPDISSGGRSSTWHGGALAPAGPPPMMGGYHHNPHHPHHSRAPLPPFPSGAADPVHSAFLPPMPQASSSAAYNQSNNPHQQSSNNGNPPREVFITTKTGGSKQQPSQSAGPGGYHIPPPQFAQYHHPHHPPPYSYPPPMPLSADPVGSSSNIGHSKTSSLAPMSGSQQQQQQQQQQRSARGAAGQTHLQAVNATVGASQQQQHHHQPPPPPPHQPQPLLQTGSALLTLPNSTNLTRLQAPGIGWPPKEDQRLTEVMSNHKSTQVNWDGLCIEHGMGRTARECHDRWTRYLKPGSRKGQWREEEDAIVLRVIFASGAGGGSVKSAGSKDSNEEQPPSTSSDTNPATPFAQAPFAQWADLAPQLPGRTGKQIRDRWVNYLNPAINHLPFSRQDDLQLWSGHKELGKRWVEISAKIFHSTRSENHIKNRWYSAAFKKFIAKEFGMDAYVDAKQSQGGGHIVATSSLLGSSASHLGQQQHQGHHGTGGVNQQHMMHHKQVVHQVGGRMHRNGVLSLNATNHQEV